MIIRPLLVFPIIIFFLLTIILLKFVSPVPYGDDLDQILWILTAQKSDSIQFLKLCFVKVNEHFVLFTRLITYVDFSLFGKASHFHWIFIGYLLFIATFIFLIKGFRLDLESKWLSVLILCLVWSDIRLYENLLWGFTSLQHNFIIFITVLCAYIAIYKESNTYFVIGIILSLFGALSSGNGIVLPLFLSIVTYFKSRKESYTYFVVFLGFVVFYWLNTQTTELKPYSINPTQFLKTSFYFLIFNLDLTNHKYTIVFISIGFFSYLYLIISLFKKESDKRIFVFALLVGTFVLASAAMVALKRSDLQSNTIEFGGRYNLYSKLYIFIIIGVIIYRFEQKSKLFVVAGVVLMINLISGWKNINRMQSFKNLSIANWYNIKYAVYSEDCEQIRWKKHINIKNTEFKEPFDKLYLNRIGQEKIETGIIDLEIIEDDKLLIFNNRALNTQNKSMFVLLVNQTSSVLLNSIQNKNSLKKFIKEQEYLGNGFVSYLQKKKCGELPKHVENSYTNVGQYSVYVIESNAGNQKKIFKTGKKIIIGCQ